jgi:hypothetical protein
MPLSGGQGVPFRDAPGRKGPPAGFLGNIYFGFGSSA